MLTKLRTLTTASVILLLLAGCSAQSSNTSAESNDTSPEGSTTTAQSESLEQEPSTTAPVEFFLTEGSGPGVSDDSVKVAFIFTDLERTAKALDFEIPEYGDWEGQVQAVTDWVNNNGGIGGRPVETVVRVHEALQDTPSTEEELCNGITQDDRVFAVVLTGQYQENARQCYASAETLMLDTTLYPVDSVGFDELSPYLWQPTLPDYSDTVSGLAAALVETDFLAGDATLGVAGVDNALNRRVYEEQFVPTLESLGAEIAETQWIDETDASTFQASQEQAILSFKDAGVDRIVIVGGGRLASWLIVVAESQNYFPTFAMSSFDSPAFNIDNNPEFMDGSIGVSLLPGWDVADDQLPFPQPGPETECLEILAATGQSFEVRSNARVGLLYCDALRLLKAAADLVSGEPLTAATWSEAVNSLGDSVQMASSYGTEFGPGRKAGGAAYRTFAFDQDCQCMVFTSEPKDFES